MQNNKISDKFIPKTNSHSKSTISNIISQIKSNNTIQNYNKKHIGIKTYKRQYKAKFLKSNSIDKNIPNLIQEAQTQKQTQKQTLHKKYVIAIPSYNRPELIKAKTLAVLHKHNINPKLINIFVADKEQYKLYKSTIPSTLYNKIRIGVKGLKNQRNYINKYYPEGYHIVQMDDDLDKIVQLVIHKSHSSKSHSKKTSKSLQSIVNLDAFIKDAFLKCYMNNIFLWGVYPLANSHFMTNTITTDLRFIVGPMFGMINRHRHDLQLTIDEKENSERTLQHWVIDGSVLRFNNIGIQTKYYKNKGGMQNEGKDRKTEALKSVYYLHKKYPKLTKINLDKKSGIAEIKFVKQSKTKK